MNRHKALLLVVFLVGGGVAPLLLLAGLSALYGFLGSLSRDQFYALLVIATISIGVVIGGLSNWGIMQEREQ